MRSRTQFLGHSIHTPLIVFPLGLLATAVIFDIVYLATDRSGFYVASAYMIGTGVIGGLLAAVFGLIDWLAVQPGTRAKRVGLLHGAGNVLVVLLFAISWLMRMGNEWVPAAPALILGFLGFAVAGVSGWLGGELVQRLGVGVHEQAGLDAPSSLTRTGGISP